LEGTRSQPPAMLGRYAVHESIGAGGMARVHLGVLAGSAGFSRVVAIKRLHAHLCADLEARAMFIDEARLSSRIDSPFVVRTLDVIDDGAEGEDGTVAIVMEYVLGASLSVALGAAGPRPVPLDVAIAIHVDVLRGLHAAHEARGADGTPLGIVHRDVSPHNALVGVDGVARLIDFGIAKAQRRLTRTSTGLTKGKQQYMAPEQLLGESVTREADVFSTAVMLWRTLTGANLFDPAADDIATRVAADVTRRPSELRPDLPAELDGIVLQALSRRPERRPPTALAFAEALSRVVRPASPAQVAAWIEDVAWDALEIARERVRRVEARPPVEVEAGRASSAPPRAPQSVKPTPDEQTADPTVSEVRDDHAPRPRPWIRRTLLVALAAPLLVVIGLTVAARRTKEAASDGAMRATAASSMPAPPATSLDVKPASEAAGAIPPLGESAAASATAPAASGARKLRRPSTGAAASPPRGAACSPPYTFDQEGHKIFDPRCF
jgi:serine/threonine-protein kinase